MVCCDSKPAADRSSESSVRKIEKLYNRALRLISRVLPGGDKGYSHIKRYNLAQATALLRSAHKAGHRRSIQQLIKLVSDNLLPDLTRRNLPDLYRDLYWLGDLFAGEKFARELDRGILCTRNTTRATVVYEQLRRTHLQRACRGDRSAMVTLARFYANGLGAANHSHISAGRTIEREWRMALAWWGRAAGMKASISSRPRVEDFPTPIDETASAALCSIADLFEHGKGVSRDVERARRLYQLAATNGGPNGKFEAARLNIRFFRRWLGAGEPAAASQGMKEAHAHLEELSAQGHPPACMELLKWEFWRQGSLAGQCDRVESSFCADVRHILADRIKYLGLASEAQSIIALRIRVYQLLVRPLEATEFASLVGSSDKLVEKVQEIYDSAIAAGYIPEPREQYVLADVGALQNILRFNTGLRALIVGQEERYREILIEYQSSYCPVNISRAQAILLRHLLSEERLAPKVELLDWLAIRFKLADLQKDIFAKEWRRTLIIAQLSSTQFSGSIGQSVPSWRARLEQAQRLGGHVRRLSQLHAAVPDQPDERGTRWQFTRGEVLRSTQDVGIIYNELHPDIGSALPRTRRRNKGLRLTGWQSVEAIELGLDNYHVIGVHSAQDIPLITEEDIDVILACQYIDGLDQSLSLEPIGGDFDASIMASQFLRKKWSPDWLSETLLGKSLYYSDYILGADETGRWNVALRPAADAALFTAEDSTDWFVPQPWELASQVGGVVTSHRSRVMHTPFAKSWRGDSSPSAEAQRSGIGKIPIPQVLSGVVGADIHFGQDSNYENRNVGEELLRFHITRVAAVATRHYATLAEAFPVYARTRAIQAINAGIYSARVNYGVQISDGLRRSVARRRKEFIEAREQKLARGGVDVVICG